jgi:hypothetical protein
VSTQPQFQWKSDPESETESARSHAERRFGMQGWLGTTHGGAELASDLLRALTSAAVMLSAVVHFQLWATGFRVLDVVGPAFLLNAIGGIVIGVLLLAWRSWVSPLLAVGFGVATLGAFLLSTTPGGFFHVHERWTSVPVWLAFVSEVAAIIGGIAVLLVELPRRD